MTAPVQNPPVPVPYAPVSGPPFDIYTIAFNCALAGMVASVKAETSADPATYAYFTQVARAYAVAWDEAFNSSTALDEIQAGVCWTASQGFWANGNRVNVKPPTGAYDPALDTATYTSIIDAMLAGITAEENAFTADGIAVPPWRGGGGGSLITVPLNQVVLGTGAPGYKGSTPNTLSLVGNLLAPVAVAGAGVALTVASGASTGASSGDAIFTSGGTTAAGGTTGVATLKSGTGVAGSSTGAVTVASGNALGSGTPGNVLVQAGSSAGTDGASLTLDGGAGGTTAGNRGGPVITAGGAAGAGSNGPGGTWTATGGAGAGTGSGGNSTLQGGAGGTGAGANGGTSAVIGGQPGAGSNGNGGAANLLAGSANGTGAGGNVNIQAGASGAGAGASGHIAGLGGSAGGGSGIAGGAVTFTAGAGDGAGGGGNATYQGGAAGATGNGGLAQLVAGNGGATSGNGGSARIVAGSTTNGTAGSTLVASGTGNITANDGDVLLRAGATNALRIDGPTKVISIQQPLLGDTTTNDPQRFGTSVALDVTAGGTFALTPTEYANQTVTLTGTAPAAPLVIQFPNVPGWTKVLDCKGADLSGVTSMRIELGANVVGFDVGVDSGGPDGLIVVAQAAGGIAVYRLSIAT